MSKLLSINNVVESNGLVFFTITYEYTPWFKTKTKTVDLVRRADYIYHLSRYDDGTGEYFRDWGIEKSIEIYARKYNLQKLIKTY